MDQFSRIRKQEQVTGLALVIGLHAAALWGLWQHRLIPGPQEAVSLFVSFIAPPVPEKEAVLPPPRPKPIEKPQVRQIVAQTPVAAPTDPVAPPPPPQAVQASVAPPAPAAPAMPIGPVTLETELAVVCPERTPPRYPPTSRRLSEEGAAVLRIELDEQGHVAMARVHAGSGYPRLDEAALAAVRTWRCHPATRNGQPVRSTALQPFKFVLQGN